MLINCNCGNPHCLTFIAINECDNEKILVTLGCKKGHESLMYLDANSTIKLIKDLQNQLAEMVR